VTREILAQRLWTAAQNDSDLRTRLRSSYRGRFDVFDALWWRANPLSPTPAGRPDPAAELIDLKAAVYRLHRDPEPLVEFVDPITQRTVYATEAEHLLRTRMREQAQEESALDAILAAAEGWTEATGAATPITGAQEPDGPDEPGTEEFGTTEPGATESVAAGPDTGEAPGTAFGAGAPWRWPRGALLLLLAGALVGALAALVLPPLIGPTDPAAVPVPSSTSTATPTQAGPVDPRQAELDVLRIFDEPADFPGGKVPELGIVFAQDSIRSIGPAPGDAGYGVYVARREQEQYCIVVQDADRTGTNVCADPDTLVRTGLWVNAIVKGTIAVSGSSRASVLLSLYVNWAPDGTITTISHPYADTCRAAPSRC